MAKDNLFLGFARGKVGDVVFSRVNGEQVARARNRAPKNPRSVLQLSQRVIMKTSSLAYSYLQDIANHSFEGYPEGTPNQSRFVKLAVAQMRGQVADALTSGSDQEILDSEEFNFSNSQEAFPVVRPYQISEGSLPSVNVAVGSQTTLRINLSSPGAAAQEGEDMTYAQAVAALGLQRGDQLTFCVLRYTGGVYLDSPCFSYMSVARFILEPSTGDMSNFIDDLSVANPRNEMPSDAWYLAGIPSANPTVTLFTDVPTMSTTAIEGGFAGVAVIVSRKSGDVWLRSTERFMIPDVAFLQGATFGNAVASFQRVQTSNLYLNQSE